MQKEQWTIRMILCPCAERLLDSVHKGSGRFLVLYRRHANGQSLAGSGVQGLPQVLTRRNLREFESLVNPLRQTGRRCKVFVWQLRAIDMVCWHEVLALKSCVNPAGPPIWADTFQRIFAGRYRRVLCSVAESSRLA
jgi:hypothetical protein